MKEKSDFFIDVLHVFVLFSFAVAQPLFDLLARYPQFFVTRHSEPIDVIFFILIACIVLPLLVVFIEMVARIIGQRVQKGVHVFVVAGLLTAIVLPALCKIFHFSGTILLMGAVILGIVGCIVYIRFHPARIFFTVLSVAILIFPSLFLFNRQISKIVFPREAYSTLGIRSSSSPPIIFVVFDEFPVTSLMDQQRQIDPIRYPNFAALSRDAYWFRSDSTVGERTTKAIPAILSGIYPDQNRLPTAAEYPHNLFTLLGGSYDMKVFESDTMLCPKELCGKKAKSLDLKRIYSMLSDLSVVYFHIILPPDLTSGLPVVTQTWKGFVSTTEDSRGRTQRILDKKRASLRDHAGLFQEFLESITISESPTLYFLHVELPHIPWRYLPSGKVYADSGLRIPGLNIKTDKWNTNEWLVIQAYQRHLLQVGFVDKLVGDLVTRLKALNLYRRSLIILTADHGVGFWPNTIRRMVSKGHPEDILPVPLFIKVPNQDKGKIIDRNAESIDILPTIADILGIRLPWTVDGTSLLNQSLPGRNYKIIYDYRSKKFVFDSRIFDAQNASLIRKLNIFGSGAKPYGLFKIGLHSEIVGRYISEVFVSGQSDIEIKLDQPSLLDHVDINSGFIPARIKGSLSLKEDIAGPLHLAIAVNTMICAVTQTFWHKRKMAQFSAMVPESAFRKGKNRVEVFLISQGKGKVHLVRTKSREAVTYSIGESDKHTEIIVSSKGESIPVVPNAIRGSLDVADISGDFVVFSGWVADIKRSRIPEAVLVFLNGKFFYSGTTDVDRPDVVEYFNNSALYQTGFKFLFSSSIIKESVTPEVRLFAVMKDVASEIGYNKEYKWKKD